MWLYPRWFIRLVESRDMWSRLPFNGWVRRPLDSLLLIADVFAAAWHSRSLEDVRRMEPPHVVEERFGLKQRDHNQEYPVMGV